MQPLSTISRLVADDLRKAERSINLAARDTAQFLLTTLDATESLSLSPAVAQRTVRATVATLSALVDGQDQMTMKAHFSIEKVGRELGLTETSWGVGAPKPELIAEGANESVPV